MDIRDAPKLNRVMRLDSIPLTKAYFTAEGFLMDKPVVTTTGIFEYATKDGGIRRELRLPEEVFAPESLKSFVGKPICISHDAGLLTSDNVAENQIGTILSEGERKGDSVVCSIVIHDTEAMKESGYKELSLGYNLDLDETPGIWNGERYDAVQRNIVVNHLALVQEARAGNSARLNMDGRGDYALKGGKTMGAKTRKTHHGDAVLSQEEFEKAIDEYKKMKSEREGAQMDEDEIEEQEEVVEQKPVVQKPAKKPTKTPERVVLEDKVKAVKDRRDLRDEAGDPADEEEALTTIAHQDEDIDILFDIIDTLMAKQDFDDAETEAEPEVLPEEEAMDADDLSGIDDMNQLPKNTAADEDDEMFEEEEELVEDEDDLEEPDLEDEFAEDEMISEEAPEEEEEFVEDEDELEDEELIEDEDDVEEDAPLNLDSVDARISKGIRNHMIMGNIGRQVGLKNLEFKDIQTAKKAIIKAVRPDMRLDGKSDTYIDSAFNFARKEIKARSKKDTAYQKKQMFNKDSKDSAVKKDSAMSARERMIARQLNRK